MIKVLILNEIRLVSEMLAMVLRSEPNMQVVAVVSTLRDAGWYINDCDIALVSVTLPGNGALEFTDQAAKDHQDVKVLITGVAENENAILQYIAAGAAGYICKNDSMEELLSNIRAAYNDKALVSPRIAAALISQYARLSQAIPVAAVEMDRSAELTSRERTVLKLISRGLSNQEIADSLYIELGTVKNHVHNILRKLNVNSRKHAALYLENYRDETREESFNIHVVGGIVNRGYRQNLQTATA
ncbi:MAG: response regulator transcription factor [Chloroflexi bacterium]|nr:response regulator transcription factor [Chloroflexota bacterium]